MLKKQLKSILLFCFSVLFLYLVYLLNILVINHKEIEKLFKILLFLIGLLIIYVIVDHLKTKYDKRKKVQNR